MGNTDAKLTAIWYVSICRSQQDDSDGQGLSNTVSAHSLVQLLQTFLLKTFPRGTGLHD